MYSVHVIQTIEYPNVENLWVIDGQAKLAIPIDLFLLLRIVNIQSVETSLAAIRMDIKRAKMGREILKWWHNKRTDCDW